MNLIIVFYTRGWNVSDRAKWTHSYWLLKSDTTSFNWHFTTPVLKSLLMIDFCALFIRKNPIWSPMIFLFHDFSNESTGWKKDNSIHMISLPHSSCLSLVKILIDNCKTLPMKSRKHQEFNVSKKVFVILFLFPPFFCVIV